LLSKNITINEYGTTILPVVLYGCETWSLTLRDEQTLTVFENRVLRRIFGPKRDEATGEWRRLHTVQLYALNSSPNIIREINSRRKLWVEQAARMWERRGVYRVLVWRSEGKRPLTRLGVDGKIILKWISKQWVGKAWIGLIWLGIGTGGLLL
jgi:hypothetical protein